MNRETFEQNSTFEQEHEQLIKLLKEKGREDPEAKAALEAWIIAQEKIAEEAIDSVRSPINFTLKIARLARAIGDLEGAWENYNIAARQAWNERLDDLNEAITGEMDDLENSLEPSSE